MRYLTIYLITFLASAVFFYSESRINRERYKIILIVFGLLLPCFLAGTRAETIGVDTAGYAQPMFSLAVQSDSYQEYVNSEWSRSWLVRSPSDIEVGFTLMVYVIAKISGSLQLLLGITQALTVVPIYICLRKQAKGYEWLGMLAYYFLFYNMTLNMMRQWIAISFLLLGYAYLIGNKPLVTFILGLCAVFFHKTALIGLLPYIVILSEKNLCSSEPDYIKWCGAITGCCLIILILIRPIIDILDILGLSYYTIIFRRWQYIDIA